MSGTLFVTGTPIGNLNDITQRQIETLSNADFIAAEDTRVTRGLLSRFDIHTELVSFHEHSSEEQLTRLADRLLAGENCALVTDAGMPCVSDPGSRLVARCHEIGVAVRVVPGPSAVTAAVAVSGFREGRFCFEGFLPVPKKQRQERLNALRDEPRAMVFYEAPHRLSETLSDLFAVLGERELTVCRELTKIYEESVRTTLSAAIRKYRAEEPRGEFVLVVEGKKTPPKRGDLEEALARALQRVDAGERAADVCREIARETGVSKRELYAALIERQTAAEE